MLPFFFFFWHFYLAKLFYTTYARRLVSYKHVFSRPLKVGKHDVPNNYKLNN